MKNGIHSKWSNISKVLIYRLGSIGDTIVALPAFRLISRVFPNAEHRVLTNYPHEAKIAPLDTIIGPLKLCHGYIRYPLKTRDPRTLYQLAKAIRQWAPQILIYLAQPRGKVKALRDALFFGSCGIRTMVGIPWTADKQNCLELIPQDLWESEASRLLRCLELLGEANLSESSNWDLGVTKNENLKAQQILDQWGGRQRFICASIGTKIWTKDWGLDNWSYLFSLWSKRHPGVGLVLVGSAEEYDFSEKIANQWQGNRLNLCGKLSPRETAAVTKRSSLFVGHDSGPMHLAASVGKPCVAIFSARNKPGEWFPFGDCHRIIYHKTDCFGCYLTQNCDYDKKCIRSISVDEVAHAIDDIWDRETS